MDKGRQCWRIYDNKQELDSLKGFGPRLVSSAEEAVHYNKQGWGIFWTVNKFKSNRRRIEDLDEIISFAVDIDIDKTSFKNKEEALENVLSYCYPSLVVETKNGLHVYYDARDGASVLDYRCIVADRLVPLLQADNCVDVSRLLRYPGYYHQKDPNEAFKVQIIFECDIKYSAKELMAIFRHPKTDEQMCIAKREIRKEFKGEDSFSRLWESDQMALLSELSGKSCVNGEEFRFIPNGSKHHIVVNGRFTSNCWIDSQNKIGSFSKGGPTVFQWLKWYGKTGRQAYEIIAEEFPWITKE